MFSVLKNSGQTSAIFQEVGKTPLVREALIMEVILRTIIGKLSLIKRGDTLSIPGAFLLGIELTISLTLEHSTVVKENSSETG